MTAPADGEADARRARALARATWPGERTDLHSQSDAIFVRHGTPGERIGMVWRITLDAWASSGRSMPQYTRATMPGRVIRATDAADDQNG
jgi:hypothetical protein